MEEVITFFYVDLQWNPRTTIQFGLAGEKWHKFIFMADKELYGPNDGKATKVTEQKESNMKSKENIKKKSGYNTKFMSHHNKRYVALKAMYFRKRMADKLTYNL
ncbi:tRNA pseudouridine(38/39) synthase [Trifolium repens]|nr:tRNA pseudouridine(38/39) synthase [Trifolium repens]WJX62637.1 tRNA pseudouridine(38/39) synthase [Trifolium repens]WJX67418.1 tRNA pseudouridine(38/39) synthase [Trifolium repens]